MSNGRASSRPWLYCKARETPSPHIIVHNCKQWYWQRLLQAVMDDVHVQQILDMKVNFYFLSSTEKCISAQIYSWLG